MGFAWAYNGNYKESIKKYFENKISLSLLGLLLLHFIWLINTSNFQYAFNDIRIKLPLFVIPFFVSAFDLKKQHLKNILFLFVFAVFAGAVVAFGRFLFAEQLNIKDIRLISVFISHIRFSIMIAIATVIIIYYWRDGDDLIQKNKLLSLGMLSFLILVLLVMKAISGIILLLVGLVILFLLSNNKRNRAISYSALGLISIFILYVAVLFYNVNMQYNKPIIQKNIELTTIRGNENYSGTTNDLQHENGNLINLNVCFIELKQVWNNTSSIDFDKGLDKYQEPIRFTLVRYLASKGYPLNQDGALLLSKEDIHNIEQGVTNYLFPNRFSAKYRIYTLLWEMNNLKFNKADLSGQSNAMRFVFFSTGYEIFKNYFWTGTGTGDVNDSFLWQYSFDQTQLSSEYRLRAHNQFLTFAISFGIIGFVFALITLLAPYFCNKTYPYLFGIIYTIILLSFFNEDTLETQAGISMFVFFIVLFSQNNPTQIKYYSKHN